MGDKEELVGKPIMVWQAELETESGSLTPGADAFVF